MALNLSFGGDNEYVGAAARAAADSKLGIFDIVKGVLDATGIHKRVSKPDDLADSQTPEGKAKKQSENVQAFNESQPEGEPVAKVSALAAAENAIGVQPLAMTQTTQPLTPWGKSYLDSLKPLTQIDPDIGILQGQFDQAFKRGS